MNLAIDKIGLVEKYGKVSDYRDTCNGWRWTDFEAKLPKEVLDKIATVLIIDEAPDKEGIFLGCYY